MTVRRLKKVLEDARKAGIVITGFKNGMFHASNGQQYTKMELLLSAKGSEALPEDHFLRKWDK